MYPQHSHGAPQPHKKNPAAALVGAAAGEEERQIPPDYISKPRPTMGTKSWSSIPYLVPVGGVMISFGNAVM